MITFLQTIDPKLIYAAIAGITWLLIYFWRRLSISSWEAVTKRSPFMQQLPALVLAGLLSAMPAIGKDLWAVVQQVLLGMLFGGGGAAAVHNLLKASPVPYTGAAPPLFPPSERRTPRDLPNVSLLLIVAGAAFGLVAFACYPR